MIVQMRFCDFFTRYKIGLNRIKGNIPFKNLPRHKRLVVSHVLLFSIIALMIYFFSLDNKEHILETSLMTITIFVWTFYSRKENIKTMLEHDYAHYSEKRMNMVIGLLRDYEIDINDVDSINLLIDEAKNAQIKSDYLAELGKPFKMIGTAAPAIIVYGAKKIGDNATQDEAIITAIYTVTYCILGYAIVALTIAIYKDVSYSEYKKYDELIYDLRQVKIFYSKKAASSSNPQNSHAAVDEK